MKKLFLSLVFLGSVLGPLFSMESDGAAASAAESAVDERDWMGMTGLHKAAYDGNVDEIRLLIARGADVNAAIEPVRLDGDLGVPSIILSGYTALHLAVWRGYGDVVEVLLEFGANVSMATKMGFTPRKIAEEMEHSAPPDSDEKMKFVKIIALLDRAVSASGAAAASGGVGIVLSPSVSDLPAVVAAAAGGTAALPAWADPAILGASAAGGGGGGFDSGVSSGGYTFSAAARVAVVGYSAGSGYRSRRGGDRSRRGRGRGR